MRASIVACLLVAASVLSADDSTAICYRDGSVTASELADFGSHLGRDGTDIGWEQGLVDDLVVLRVLEARFAELGLGAVPENAWRLKVAEWEIAESWLRQRLAVDAAPSENDVLLAYEKDPGRMTVPRMWRLENIFKRWPTDASEEEREELRGQLHELRLRLLAGEAFDELARQESDSQTRLRGGRMGMVSLDQLAPVFAAVVKTMGEGDLSEVIETADGLTLLRCTQVLAPRQGSFEASREKIARELRSQRFTTAWEATSNRLLAEIAPAYHLDAIRPGGAPEVVVATFSTGNDREQLPLWDYLLFLRRRRVTGDPSVMPASVQLDRLRERLLLEAREPEARRLGFGEDREQQETLLWKQRELRARIALDSEVAKRITGPSTEELHDLYEGRRESLTEPERLLLRAVKVPITADQPRDTFQRLEELTRVAASLDEIARALHPAAELVELGWMTRDRVWMMGVNVEHAVAALEPGQSSLPVQEGRTMLVLSLVARRPERQLTFDEAAPKLREIAVATRRLEVEEAVRREIIAAQQIGTCP